VKRDDDVLVEVVENTPPPKVTVLTTTVPPDHGQQATQSTTTQGLGKHEKSLRSDETKSEQAANDAAPIVTVEAKVVEPEKPVKIDSFAQEPNKDNGRASIDVEDQPPSPPSVRFHWGIGAVEGIDHVANAAAHGSALQAAIAKSQARAAKQVLRHHEREHCCCCSRAVLSQINIDFATQAEELEAAKAAAGADLADCTEEAWCKVNLKVQSDGSPHENCKSWKKSCPCTCAEGQVAPPKKQINFFHDHAGVSLGDHTEDDRAALKAAVASATSTSKVVDVGAAEFEDQDPWLEIVLDTSADVVLDPQAPVDLWTAEDGEESLDEKSLRVRSITKHPHLVPRVTHVCLTTVGKSS